MLIERFNYNGETTTQITLRKAVNEFMKDNKCYPKEEWPAIKKKFITTLKTEGYFEWWPIGYTNRAIL